MIFYDGSDPHKQTVPGFGYRLHVVYREFRVLEVRLHLADLLFCDAVLRVLLQELEQVGLTEHLLRTTPVL